MSVLKVLRQRVAPELNHLYTVPPFTAGGEFDPGWYSREHALHTFFAARLLGAPADLRTGDFAVLSRALPPITTLESQRQHAWCSVEGVAPVDLSVNFAFFTAAPKLRGPIAGEGANGEWQVRYARDEAVLDEKIQHEHEILYIEKHTRAEPPDALLDDPFVFLPPPQPGDTTSWHAVFGPDIYAKVSLHCWRAAIDEARSVRHRLPPPQAIAWIAANYPAPEAQIREQLHKPA